METSAWPEEHWAALGEAIARARRAKGWDQAALAARTGNSPNTISNYERGRATKSRRVPSGISRVAQVFGWPSDAVKQILSGEDPELAINQPRLDFVMEGDSGQATAGNPPEPPRLMSAREAELTSSGHLAQDTFLRQMKRFRKMNGISIENLAERVTELGGDLSTQDLARLESGTRLLRLAEADVLAAALDTTVDWLLGSAFQSGMPEELTAPPTDEELQAEAKAIERRILEVGTQLNQAAMQHVQAIERAEMAKHDAEMARMLTQQISAQKYDLERQYHYLLGRIDSLRAAKGEEQVLQRHLVTEVEHETLGKQLERARKRLTLSPQDVHEMTGIRPSVLGQMEQDDFTSAGRNADVRMYLRRLAHAYDLPPASVVQEFDEVYADPDLPAPLRQWRELEATTGRQFRPRKRGEGFVTAEQLKTSAPAPEGDSVASTIRRARLEIGTSLGEVAKRTGLSVNHLMAVETGDQATLERNSTEKDPEARLRQATDIVRRFAEAVGLGPDTMVEQYLEERSKRLAK